MQKSSSPVTVYIWKFKGSKVAWGHASLQVKNTYISWWPEGSGRVHSKVPNIYSANPIRNRTLEGDIRGEGGAPDEVIQIEGLDGEKILSWWSSFGLIEGNQLLQGPLPAWQTISQNCSTVVAKALKQGGGDRFSSLFSSHSIMWTPQKVSEYAKSIREGVEKLKR